MSFQKIIPIGSAGQIEFDESGLDAKMVLSLGGSLGGGSVAGALKGKASVELDASVLQFVDAGLVALEAKFPSLAAGIAVLKGLIDAEAPKV